MTGICTSPYPIEKIGISYTHTQSMREFSVKTGTGSGNTHEDGFICGKLRGWRSGWVGEEEEAHLD